MGKQASRQSIPDDLSGVDDADLDGMYEDIAARVEDLAEADDPSDAEIDEIERLGEEAKRVQGEKDARSEAKANRQARRDQALKNVRGGDPDGEVDEPGDEPGDVEDAEDVEEPQAAAAANGQGTALATRRKGSLRNLNGRKPARSRPKATRGGFGMVATAHADEIRAGEPFDDVRQLAASISKKRNSPGFRRAMGEGQTEYMTVGSGDKTIIDPRTGETPALTKDDYVRNFSVLREAQVRMAEAGRQMSSQQAIVAAGGAVEDAVEGLVASGACCTPLTPMYDFFRLAEPQTPVEDASATVQAPRGGIRFIVPPDYQRLLAAVGVQNCGNNTNPASPEFKPCLHVDCPTIAEMTVSAVSTCVTFGNLQYMTFPEQVEAFLEDLAVAHDSTKEVTYLNMIDANSTAVTNDTAYGAFRALLFDLTTSAVAYRKRHGMRRGATLQVYLPDWSIDMLKADMLNDGHQGFDWINVPDSEVESALRSRGLDPVWYNDTAANIATTTNLATTSAGLSTTATITAIATSALSATLPAGLVQISSGGNTQVFATAGAASGATSVPVSATQPNYAYPTGSQISAITVGPNMKFNQIQAAGALNPFPGQVVWYMSAPGSFVRLDGGSLDVGLVRDSILNRTNDLQIFAEEWTGMAFVGLESIKGTSTVCASGGGSNQFTPITCGGTASEGAGVGLTADWPEFAGAGSVAPTENP